VLIPISLEFMQGHPNDGIGYAARYVYLVMNLQHIYFVKMDGKRENRRKILFAKTMP